jgi:hypothetical protein
MTDQDLHTGNSVRGLFEDWHANLLRIDRRKCLLFTDSQTLFVFLVPAVLRRDLAELQDLLRSGCADTLRSHGIDPASIPVISSDDHVTIAKTNDRRVLGSMNDYAFLFKVHIEGEGGLEHCDIPSLNRKINETPMGMLKYNSAIQEVRNKLGRHAI